MTDTRLEEITDRIAKRSAPDRSAYLDDLSRRVEEGPGCGALACGKLAHAVAACAPRDKERIIDGRYLAMDNVFAVGGSWLQK